MTPFLTLQQLVKNQMKCYVLSDFASVHLLNTACFVFVYMVCSSLSFYIADILFKHDFFFSPIEILLHGSPGITLRICKEHGLITARFFQCFFHYLKADISHPAVAMTMTSKGRKLLSATKM